MKDITIIQPDDWHVHLRENKILTAVVKYTASKFGKCIAMPNLESPIISWQMAEKYKKEIINCSGLKDFKPFIPCYLIDELDLDDFTTGIKNNYFIGAKLYPYEATTNSSKGVTNIENIYPALEILEKHNSPLLIHGEKVSPNISIFDREKFFIDDELKKIIDRFSSLKIVLEHVSSSYGADFVAESSNNIAATITVHHLLLTKKDVFDKKFNPHNYCMPVVKDEKDLIVLRQYACSGNKKFFIGTDSAPHDIIYKKEKNNTKPGIFTSPIALELYLSIFDEEEKIENFEKFSSINGSNFYNLPINDKKITLEKNNWINSEFTKCHDIQIKNFMGGKKIKWKIKDNI